MLKSLLAVSIFIFSVTAKAESIESKKDSSIVFCLKDNIPEAIISGGIYAAILNPISIALSVGYYGNSIYKCYEESESNKKAAEELELKNKLVEEQVKLFESKINRFESDYSIMAEKVSKSEESMKKEVQDSIMKVKEDYVNLNKSLAEYSTLIKDRQEQFSKAVDSKIVEMDNSNRELKLSLEEKANQEKENILETGDRVIKTIYDELKKIEQSEVKIERKIEDKESPDTFETKEQTVKPLDGLSKETERK